MFSRPVEHVSKTNIFARGEADGRQYLVYSMNVSPAEPLAMILPIPVPVGCAEDAVRFIDLSHYADFFKDLHESFPKRAPSLGMGPRTPSGRSKLKVHRVGSFEASFVPGLEDFDRLDECFRLPADVWAQFSLHQDYGFAVFKLAPRRSLFGRLRKQTIHPMAFSFPRRDSHTLFFPTVHVHEGVAHDGAIFDHTLYCQPDPYVAETFSWETSWSPAEESVDLTRAQGIVDGARPIYRRMLRGGLANEDVVLTTPVLRDLSVLTVSGPLFRCRLRAFTGNDSLPKDPRPGRRHTAIHQLDALHELLFDGLQALTSLHEQQWGLRPPEDDLPEHTYTDTEFSQLYFRAHRHPGDVPCTVGFSISTARVECQKIRLGFTRQPPEARCEEIGDAIIEIFDRLPIEGS